MTESTVQSLKSDEGFTVTSTTQNQEQLKAQFNKAPETPKEPAGEVEEQEVDTEGLEAADKPAEDEQKGADGKPLSRHKSPTARVQYATRIAAEAKRERDEIEAKWREAQTELEKLRGAAPKVEASKVQTPADSRPKQEDFDDYDKWQEAVMDWKIEQREATSKANQQRELALEHQKTMFQAFQTRIGDAIKADPTIDEKISPAVVALIPKGPVDLSKSMSFEDFMGTILVGGAPDIIHPDKTLDLMKYLSNNADEQLQRLRTLGQGALLAELGRLDGRLSSAPTATEPKATQISRANPPVRPVTAVPPSGDDEPDPKADFDVWAKQRLRQEARERKQLS